ncbi:MAG: hypothetical protein NC339_06205 [Muribaculaceae bacterium]|nr:hypothetical protein [Muribaculaceae bacterium]
MSLWTGVKQVFGFSPDEEDDEEYLDANIPKAVPEVQPTPVATHAATENETGDTASSHETAEACGDPTLPADLFDAVLEVFNSAQPDFIRRCISTEAQREYLLNSLSERLRSRLSRVVGAEAITADEELKAECKRLTDRVAQLEKESKVTEALKRENSRLRLSIENQKRALQDRITDLEIRIEKSGINPTKGEKPEKEEHHTETQADTADTQALEMLGAELRRQTTLREQAEMKSRMADSMLTDLRNTAADYRRQLQEYHDEQEQAVALFESKMAEYEGIKRRLERNVEELSKQIQEYRSAGLETRIAALNQENATLRHNIENNLYNQANAEMRLRKEIKELKARLESAPTDAAEPQATYSTPAQSLASASSEPGQASQKRKRGRPRKVRIDTELGDTDVFDTQTKAPAKEDPDFGYHEPPRRPGNTDEAQLTLFD